MGIKLLLSSGRVIYSIYYKLQILLIVSLGLKHLSQEEYSQV